MIEILRYVREGLHPLESEVSGYFSLSHVFLLGGYKRFCIRR